MIEKEEYLSVKELAKRWNLSERQTAQRLTDLKVPFKEEILNGGGKRRLYSTIEIRRFEELQQQQQIAKNQAIAEKINKKYSDEEVMLAFGNNLDNKTPEEILKLSLQMMGLSLNKMKDAKDIEINSLKKENDHLKTKLGLNEDYYSVKRVSMLNKKSLKDYNWRTLKNKSFELGIEIKDEQDSNYGTVKSYHIKVWKECYPNEKYL